MFMCQEAEAPFVRRFVIGLRWKYGTSGAVCTVASEVQWFEMNGRKEITSMSVGRGTKRVPEIYLQPTDMIDSDHPAVGDFASEVCGGLANPLEMAVRLYLAVRDGIRYDPYTPFYRLEHYRASNILAKGRGFCIPKASLLCALTRAKGIPSRLGFATVRNHLATKQLLDTTGSDVFPYHAYVDIFLEGQWVKATPAFNKELCERHHVAPLEFDGRHDSLFQPYNEHHEKYMEYLEDHGTFADVPLEAILASWELHYGKERLSQWIAGHEAAEPAARDFYEETVVTH